MDNTVKENMILELRRVEEDTNYSARNCLETATCWGKCYLYLGIPATILAAVSGAISAYDGEYSPIAAACLSILIAILAGLQTFLNPKDISKNYTDTGNSYLALRNRARIFRTITLESSKNIEDEKLLLEFNQITALRDELNSNCPSIPRWAYEKAKKNIENGETTHAVDLPRQD